MGKLSKRKGSSFERKTSLMLTGLTGLAFRRTYGSGANKFQQRSLDESGDLKCEDESFPFVLECKHYAEISYAKIMEQDCKLIDRWIAQLTGDSIHQKKNGILVFKSNRMPTFFLFIDKTKDRKLTKFLKKFNHITFYKGYGILTEKLFRKYFRRIIKICS